MAGDVGFLDFSSVTPFERFVASLETALGMLREGGGAPATKALRVPHDLPFRPEGYVLTWYAAEDGGTNHRHPSAAVSPAPKLRAWFGVSELLTLEPGSYSGRVIDEAEATALLSALSISLAGTQSTLPAFVPIHDAVRDAWEGVMWSVDPTGGRSEEGGAGEGHGGGRKGGRLGEEGGRWEIRAPAEPCPHARLFPVHFSCDAARESSTSPVAFLPAAQLAMLAAACEGADPPAAAALRAAARGGAGGEGPGRAAREASTWPASSPTAPPRVSLRGTSSFALPWPRQALRGGHQTACRRPSALGSLELDLGWAYPDARAAVDASAGGFDPGAAESWRLACVAAGGEAAAPSAVLLLRARPATRTLLALKGAARSRRWAGVGPGRPGGRAERSPAGPGAPAPDVSLGCGEEGRGDGRASGWEGASLGTTSSGESGTPSPCSSDTDDEGPPGAVERTPLVAEGAPSWFFGLQASTARGGGACAPGPPEPAPPPLSALEAWVGANARFLTAPSLRALAGRAGVAGGDASLVASLLGTPRPLPSLLTAVACHTVAGSLGPARAATLWLHLADGLRGGAEATRSPGGGEGRHAASGERHGWGRAEAAQLEELSPRALWGLVLALGIAAAADGLRREAERSAVGPLALEVRQLLAELPSTVGAGSGGGPGAGRDAPSPQPPPEGDDLAALFRRVGVRGGASVAGPWEDSARQTRALRALRDARRLCRVVESLLELLGRDGTLTSLALGGALARPPRPADLVNPTARAAVAARVCGATAPRPAGPGPAADPSDAAAPVPLAGAPPSLPPAHLWPPPRRSEWVVEVLAPDPGAPPRHRLFLSSRDAEVRIATVTTEASL